MKEGKSAHEECSEKERYIHALELQVETFALLASRLASLLHPGRNGDQGNMPTVRSYSRRGSKAVAEVEVASGTSGSQASTGKKRASSKAASHQVAPKPLSKNGLKYRQSPEYREKQKEYQRRHAAKKRLERESAAKQQEVA